jgi:predicted AAA+ superfamily ATPase
LIENIAAKGILDEATNSSDLFLRISALADTELIAGKTLIFIDEVQESKEIVTAIKFLVENFDYDFILSGSLLGVELEDIRSLPVGYLDVIEMYPLDLEEFWWARGVNCSIIEEVQRAFMGRTEVPDFIHSRMIDLFHEYLIIGGMPAAVEAFAESMNLQTVRSIHRNIVYLYRKDVSKYDRPNALLIKKIFDLIPAELNSQNKRFVMNRIGKSARFTDIQSDFEWLTKSGVALATFAVTEPKYPLLLAEKSQLFKLFLCDVGLLSSMFMKDTTLGILVRDDAINYGAIYENAVAQELRAHGFDLYYYNSKSYGELDFVIETISGRVIPLEIKSGKDYKRHKALSNVLKVKNYAIPEGFVFYNGNVEVRDRIIYLPIYMIDCMKPSEWLIE